MILLQIPQSAKIAGEPAAPGVYYRNNNKQWIQLQAAVVDESKTQGIKLFNDTGGYTNFSVHVFYREAKSLLRIPVPNPAFLVRAAGSSKDVVLIKLSQKGSRRAFRTSPSDATVENKSGFNKKDIQRIDVTEYPDRSFSLTPAENLKAGEYLLVFGSAMPGYDFGVDLMKQ
jgi:hypothetical protein